MHRTLVFVNTSTTGQRPPCLSFPHYTKLVGENENGPQVAITAPSSANILPQQSPWDRVNKTTRHGSYMQLCATEPKRSAAGTSGCGLRRGVENQMCRGKLGGDHQLGGETGPQGLNRSKVGGGDGREGDNGG